MKKTIVIVILAFFNTSFVRSQVIEKFSISGKGTLDIFSDRFYAEGFKINAFTKLHMFSIGFYHCKDYEDLLWGDGPKEKDSQLTP
ncbi:MAG: hypothetical protein ACI9JN_001707 [Bacteroidia bacterium]|jgi:hypothetical protein